MHLMKLPLMTSISGEAEVSLSPQCGLKVNSHRHSEFCDIDRPQIHLRKIPSGKLTSLWKMARNSGFVH